MLFKQKNLQSSYDLIANEYAREYYKELEEKPLDRYLLEQFVLVTKEKGLVCEIGCGPGQIGRFLWDRGTQIYGFDLSRGMLISAKNLNKGISFVQGDMRYLPVQDSSHAGVVAFYSVNHIERADLSFVLREVYRILLPGGIFLFSIHLGEGDVHTDEWFNKRVSVDTTFFSLSAVEKKAENAGFTLELSIKRNPYPNEWQNQRGYVWAVKQ